MAKNQRYTHNDHIALHATAATASGQAVKIGQYVGVAQTAAAVGERVTIWLNGSYDLQVGSATAEGDIVYIADADGTLSTTATGGFPFGVANAEQTAAGVVEVAPFGMITDIAAGV